MHNRLRLARVMCSAMGIGTGGVMGGAVMGFAGGMIGGFINGVGFTALGGGNFKESLIGGLKGAVLGAATGIVVGGAIGGGKAFFDGKNVWSGNNIAPGRSAFSLNNTPAKGSALKAFTEYNFTPDPHGDNVTLYRGTTGSEANMNKPLFMTDDANYAAQYVANGGKVVEVTIPRNTLFQMQQNGVVSFPTPGIYAPTGVSGLEYIISPQVKNLFINSFKIY